jgi:hypothetical protein
VIVVVAHLEGGGLQVMMIFRLGRLDAPLVVKLPFVSMEERLVAVGRPIQEAMWVDFAHSLAAMEFDLHLLLEFDLDHLPPIHKRK